MNLLLDVDRFNASKFALESKSNNVVEDLIVPALIEIGEGWQSGIYSLSQVYMSSVICEEISEELFAGKESKTNQTLNVAIVTFDDYHTFGKKLVTLTLKSAGYKIYDFGMLFEEEKLLALVKEHDIDVLLMSVLMLPPALRIREMKPKLLEQKPGLKIIVGGAPFRFDKELYKKVGADGTGDTPDDAIAIIREMEASL
jgi:methanogenic corrinoid protein MtbC1